LSFSNGVEYIDTMLESESFKECLTERFVTYIVGETPETCDVQNLMNESDAVAAPVDQLLLSLVRSPLFQQRGAIPGDNE
ncbi:MAG: DUF1585 domain-containing protein, partial [Myxococcota bacterium]